MTAASEMCSPVLIRNNQQKPANNNKPNAYNHLGHTRSTGHNNDNNNNSCSSSSSKENNETRGIEIIMSSMSNALVTTTTATTEQKSEQQVVKLQRRGHSELLRWPNFSLRRGVCCCQASAAAATLRGGKVGVKSNSIDSVKGYEQPLASQVVDDDNDDAVTSGLPLMTGCWQCNSMPTKTTTAAAAINVHGDKSKLAAVLLSSTSQLSSNSVNGNGNVQLGQQRYYANNVTSANLTMIKQQQQQQRQSLLVLLAALVILAAFNSTTTKLIQLGQQQQQRQYGSMFLFANAAMVPPTTSRYNHLVYPNSKWGCSDSRRANDVERLLCMLVYDLKPLVDNYIEAFAPNQSHDPKVKRLIEMSGKVEKFAQEAFSILDRREFCTYALMIQTRDLKNELTGSSDNQLQHLLLVAFDMVAIELHKSCLLNTIEKLPQVPFNIRDIVQIYIDGVDTSIIDLNSDPQQQQQKHQGYEKFSLDRFNSNDDDGAFNIDEAIARNGPLDQVMSLSLWMPLGAGGDSSDRPQVFIRECRNFFQEISDRWTTMDIMNMMLDTEGNSIKRLNNFIMRRLTPTKYADICSQICLRYESSH